MSGRPDTVTRAHSSSKFGGLSLGIHFIKDVFFKFKILGGLLFVAVKMVVGLGAGFVEDRLSYSVEWRERMLEVLFVSM